MPIDDLAARRAALAERRAKLSPEKQALLERLLQGEPTDAAKPADSSLVMLQAGDAGRRPLFFVHPGVGEIVCYAELARLLGHAQPFYGLQARGLRGEQEPLTRVQEMASDYLKLIQTVQPQGPPWIGGWSSGGLVAFEIAQQLQAQDQPAGLLALVDCGVPPGDPNFEPDELHLLAGLAQGLGLSLRGLEIDPESLRRLALDEQLAQLLELARRARTVPAEMDLAQLRHVFNVFKHNVRAARHYALQPYPGTLVLFKASEQFGDAEPDLGWGAWVQNVKVEVVPGEHYGLMREPSVSILAARLKSYLTGD